MLGHLVFLSFEFVFSFAYAFTFIRIARSSKESFLESVIYSEIFLISYLPAISLNYMTNKGVLFMIKM